MKVLILNAGSSSLKSHLFEISEITQSSAAVPTPLWQAQADWTKGSTELKIQAVGETIEEQLATDDRAQIIERLLQTLHSGKTAVLHSLSEIDAVGHRVVHGGNTYAQSVRITPEVKNEIRKLAGFAPLHNPANLQGIEATEQVLPNTPAVAVFDTSFHSTMPDEAKIYPGPYDWFEQGIHRYGFHGTSHQYCTRRVAQLLHADPASLRLINCHLGNGCSLAAILGGRSIDTTMGFTPLEGLMMGTRSGSIDPSILLYLQREHSYTPEKLDHILNKESGLQGTSGLSNDMRQIEQAMKEGNERAQIAYNLFIYRLRYFVGAMLAVLGGVDVLSFTGGIGENAPEVRAKTCEGFAFLHLQLDSQKNAASRPDTVISTPDSNVSVLLIHTEEDWEIARECWHTLHTSL